MEENVKRLPFSTISWSLATSPKQNAEESLPSTSRFISTNINQIHTFGKYPINYFPPASERGAVIVFVGRSA
jgi:hypothetical protein